MTHKEAKVEATMEIDGESYVEATPNPVSPDPVARICGQCAFAYKLAKCAQAINKSAAIFGGDCSERDVVYRSASSRAGGKE